MTGCSKFGLDSPVPSVTKRLAFYGNNEDIVKQVEQACSLNPLSQIDPSLFTTANQLIFNKPQPTLISKQVNM